MLSTIRSGVGISRRLINTIERNVALRRWRGEPASNASSAIETGHLLVVKRVEYVSIARVCVESFLHFNPHSSLVIHSDEYLFKQLVQTFQGRIQSGQVEVKDTFTSNHATWQECKIDLLLSMSGSKDFFMDADLRWNGPKPTRDGVLFFVQEFDMLDKSPFRQLARCAMADFDNGTHMRNTSYFSFGGFELSEAERSQVMRFQKEFPSLLESADLGSDDTILLTRLSEQIALSVLSDRWTVPISFLKEADGHRDGAFVESSYFGATGSSFG